MIVTQARNLFPEEVEARLMAHPDIAQAAVLGLPDPQRGVSMGGNIQATLANLQANFGFDLISNALDGGQSSASSTGWAVLASLAPMSIAKLSKGAIRVTSRMGKGKVAYLSKRKPLIHEIETAEFIADRKMVGIYLVGGNSSAGADAFINGL